MPSAEQRAHPEPWRDPQAKPYVTVDNVTKKFDDVYAVDRVSLSIYKGEIFALLGSSGCGKSTLLRMLAGFETPTEGHIVIDGTDMSRVEPYHRPVNMMFQSYALFPHMNVEQNVSFGLKQDRVPTNELRERVDEVLELVELSGYRRRKPHQLSGGQKQRVALARSLVKRPKLLLLDEPLGALDKKLRERTQFELVAILERVGVTCIMVTHDQEEAMTMASRIGVMNEGQILQVGTPSEIYEYPNCRFCAGFIGSVNLFEGTVTEDEPDYVVIKSPDVENNLYIDHGFSGTEGMQVAVAVRPEKINVSREPPAESNNSTRGVVHDIGYLGSHSIYHVRLTSGKVVVATMANLERYKEDRLTWDQDVYLSWHANSGVVLVS